MDQERKWPLIFLAGGQGTRIQSEIGNLPKILAPIDGKPFLHYLLRSLRGQPISRIIFSLKYQAPLVINALASVASDLPMEFCVEPEFLGTGGAFKYACKYFNLNDDLTSQVFMANADGILKNAFSTLAHSTIVFSEPTCANILGLVHVPDASRFGAVDWDEKSKKIITFQEKSKEHRPGLINAGVGLYSVKEVCAYPSNSFSIEKDYYPTIAAQKKLYGCKIPGSFIDIGVPEDYRFFCEHYRDYV